MVKWKRQELITRLIKKDTIFLLKKYQRKVFGLAAILVDDNAHALY